MLTLFLSKRFFKSSYFPGKGGKRPGSSPSLRIATAGIAIGLAVMIVSVCIVVGFKNEVSRKLTGFAAHLQVLDPSSFATPEYSPIDADASLTDFIRRQKGVTHTQYVSQKLGIFKTDEHFAGVSFRGVGEDYDLAFLSENLVEGKIPRFYSAAPSDSVLVSEVIAKNLGLKVGDKVYSYFFANTIKQRRFTVAGIYNTHLRQFDKTVVVTDRYTVNRLNAWHPSQCSSIEILLSSFDYIRPVQQAVKKQMAQSLPSENATRTAVSIYENPQTAATMSWLNLLDFNVMVILIIMIGVSGFAMISGLLILILERTATIGLLKALGATNRTVRRTFLWFAAFIVVRGMVLGNVIGLLLVAIQGVCKVVKLNPETYYIDTVPVEVDWTWIIALNAVSFAVTMLILVLPSMVVTKISPAKAIRFD